MKDKEERGKTADYQEHPFFKQGKLQERERIDKIIDEKLKENPYPIDIFPEIEHDDLIKINNTLEKIYMIPLDRLSAHISRLVMNNKLEELKKEVEK